MKLRLAVPVMVVLIWVDSADGQSLNREEAIVRASTVVLDEVMAVPMRSIPSSLLARAHGVAIIPNVIKGGFIVGARHGSGVLLVRGETGAWHGPTLVTITGGNIGFQAGLQATDVVLVFTTPRSVQRMLTRQFAIGVDAAAAAGPVGRQASAATDGQLKAEIYSYSRSRGLFAGVSLDGSVIQVDALANAAYYHSTPEGQTIMPPSAAELVSHLAAYTGHPQPSQIAPRPPAGQNPELAVAGASEADHLRNQLRLTAPELYERLNPQWNAFLALPASVFTGAGHPSASELQSSLAHFDQVAAAPGYRALQQLPQFQSTYGLLRHYQSVLQQSATVLELPPPPSQPVAGSRSAPIPQQGQPK